MKKTLVLFFVIMSSIVSFAQSLEVRGVETKIVVYEGPEYKVYNGSNRIQSLYKYSTKWFGYSFCNMNSIPISVEAEFYVVRWQSKPELVDTKTFNLKSKETYIWKHENRNAFKVNDKGRDVYPYSSWTDKTEPENGQSYATYLVKYKAFKIL